MDMEMAHDAMCRRTDLVQVVAMSPMVNSLPEGTPLTRYDVDQGA